MSRRTTIVLAVINAALLAFIYFVERGRLSTGDVARRSGHVLTRFIRDRVDRVELTRGDAAPIVLVRERDEEADGDLDLGTWRIAAPIEADADDDAVDSFLSALEWLDARRTLDAISDEDRGRFGLDDPRFVVSFAVGDERGALRVGGEAPTGEGVYAAVEGEARAFVVGQDFVESIDHDVDHFRSRDLFARFYPTDATSIRLEGGGPAVVLERTGGIWKVREPVAGHASASLVDGLTRALRELDAARFVAEGAEGLGDYGLDAPWRELTVVRPDDASGLRRARLRVGAPCGEHEGERYAIAGDEGPVVCVLASDLSALDVDREHLLEARLVTMGDDAIERIELAVGGRRLELRRGDDGWELEAGGATRPADDAAIATWLGELRGSRALSFSAVEGAPGHGLRSPRATLTLHPSDSDGTRRVALGDAGEDGVWVRRDDEASLGRFPIGVEALLTADALRFHERDLLDGVDVGQARVVTRTVGGLEERAVRGDAEAWRLEAPVATDADRVAVRDVARHVAELSAARFVAAAPTAEHGLDAPSVVVAVRFEPDGEDARTVELAVGTQTVDGAYARLDGEGPVFEIAREVLEALQRPLVSLDLMTVETSEIASVQVERGGEVIALRRDGSAWRTADGAAADAERTRALLDRIATLRAGSLVAYAAGAAAEVRVVVTRRPGTEGARTVTLSLGAPSGEGDAAVVPVWRDDPAITLGFRPELVEIFRTYVP